MEYAASQLLDVFPIFGVLVVGLEDVLHCVDGPVPCAHDGAGRVAVPTMQHAPEAHFFPPVGLLITVAVCKCTQQSVIGDDDAVHSQCSWPAIYRKLVIVLLPLLHAKQFRVIGLARSILQHLPLPSKTSPALIEFIPISAFKVGLGISGSFHVLLGEGEVLGQQQAEPVIGRLVLDGESSKECSHVGSQIAQRVVMSHPARLNGDRGELVEVIVEVESNAGSPH